MNLRRRLLGSFMVVAALVLTLFGTVAYHIAVDVGKDQESALLAIAAQGRAQALAGQGRLAVGTPPASPSHWGALEADERYLMLVIDKTGRVVAGTAPEQHFGMKSSPLFYARIAQSARQGHAETGDGHEIYWASAPIPGSTYTAIAIHRENDEANPILGTLAMRMLATAAVVIWITVWGALSLSAIIARRLDKQNSALLHQALHDSLTDLPNRTHLYERLREMTHQHEGEPPALALLVMDLDRFKEINDTLGHDAGDQLLLQVAARMAATCRGNGADLVARLGGDEFAVLVPGLDAAAAQARARATLHTLVQPCQLNGITVTVNASIGVALYPAHGTDAGTLIRRAEVAMYEAKRKNAGCEVYHPELDHHDLRRLALMNDLRQAVETGHLSAYYQPKVDLSTHRVSGVETLARWQHPQYGQIAPSDFIPLAEQSDIIGPLTLWVLDNALGQLQAWRAMGLDLDVAVNLSARNLHDPALPDQVAGLLAKWDVPAACLELEITESAIMAEPEHAMRILERIDAMGVRLSIDDFGTGYSSLVYLKSMPVSELKIDRSFVMHMARAEDDAVIVRSTIDLAHNLGCRVVAEGVEDADTLQRLTALGCDTAQGFHIARPMPAPDLTRWLQTSAWPPRTLTAPGPARHATPLRPARGLG